MTAYYSCCGCCEHFPPDGEYPDRHAEPCEGGCNDGQATP